MMTDPECVEQVKNAATGYRVIDAIKENRIEVIGLLILGHLLGLSDKLLSQVSGMCI